MTVKAGTFVTFDGGTIAVSEDDGDEWLLGYGFVGLVAFDQHTPDPGTTVRVGIVEYDPDSAAPGQWCGYALLDSRELIPAQAGETPSRSVMGEFRRHAARLDIISI